MAKRKLPATEEVMEKIESEEYAGWCTFCGDWTHDACEPDAHHYKCPECENNTVVTKNNPPWLKYDLVRYRGFYIKYSPATNSAESRIYIRDMWFRTAVFISYGSSPPDSYDLLEKAEAFLRSIGIEIQGMVGSDGYDTLLSTNFETRLRKSKKCPSSN